MKIGIDQISFYIPQHYLDLKTLAEEKGIDPNKYIHGIGQEKIAIPSQHEDVVTMGAEAAHPLLQDLDLNSIDTVLFATETSIDQSKSAGIYVHRLLGLPSNCRNVELKQACYSATAALQLACGYVARKPDKKVLIIASDISRYDLDTPGEATQGAGAVAMIISANPKIIEIDSVSGCYSEDIMDFWRPNYRKTPLVDGKYSALKYLHSLAHAWKNYLENRGNKFKDFKQFCYHLPFTRMAEKAHKHLSSINDQSLEPSQYESGLIYNRQIGNCYNASLYISLISVLENYETSLENENIAFFSYGSGATAEFFSGNVQESYQDYLYKDLHQELLKNRTALSYQEYLKFWNVNDPEDGSKLVIKNDNNKGRYGLSRIENHKRYYEKAA
ncbi:MAG: hydroxymethylglutaryl-CoA synthase [Pseudomonadota bacterium]